MSRVTKTERVELVETHNIALALQRLNQPGMPYNHHRWKRALQHAVALAELGDDYARKIREALELP